MKKESKYPKRISVSDEGYRTFKAFCNEKDISEGWAMTHLALNVHLFFPDSLLSKREPGRRTQNKARWDKLIAEVTNAFKEPKTLKEAMKTLTYSEKQISKALESIPHTATKKGVISV